MSSPIGSGGQYTPGSPEDQAARADTSSPLGALGSVLTAGPLTMIFGGLTASVYNFINVGLNTAFFGLCTVGGFIIAAFGLYSLTQEIPGMAGIGKGIVPVAKKAVSIVGLAGAL